MAKKKVYKSVNDKKILHGLVINCVMLNVRTEPMYDSNVVEVLSAGTEIEIIDKVGNWYKLSNGFVMSDFVEVK